MQEYKEEKRENLRKVSAGVLLGVSLVPYALAVVSIFKNLKNKNKEDK